MKRKLSWSRTTARVLTGGLMVLLSIFTFSLYAQPSQPPAQNGDSSKKHGEVYKSLLRVIYQYCSLPSAMASNDPVSIKKATECLAKFETAKDDADKIDKELESEGTTEVVASAIRKACRLDDAGLHNVNKDAKWLRKAEPCVRKELQAKSEMERNLNEIEGNLNEIYEIVPPTVHAIRTGEAETRGAQQEQGEQGQLERKQGEQKQRQQEQRKAEAARAEAPANGQQVMGSVYTTPTACIQDSSQPNNGRAFTKTDLIGIQRALLAPKEASDDYGRRLGKRYIIYQVFVSNYSKDYQYIMHDISVDLGRVLTQGGHPGDDTGNLTEHIASSRDLQLLRGVPEKGMDLDPRNLTLHILTGVGSVAASVNGLTPFSDVMGSAVASFNGAFLQSFVGIAPDHTATQLNRLSDQAFTTNTVVDKLHTKTLAVFIPAALVLSNDQQNKFWRNPRNLLDTIKLDRVNICVNGSLVTEVSLTPGPLFPVSDTDVGPETEITIQDSDPNAAIYYTTDGLEPSTTSTKYSGPITLPKDVNSSETIRAIAVSPNKQQSSVVSQTYLIKRKPTVKPMPTGKPMDASEATITITPRNPADSIWYTTDGSDPNNAPAGQKGNAGTPVTITLKAGSTTTLKVVEHDEANSTVVPDSLGTFVYTVNAKKQ